MSVNIFFFLLILGKGQWFQCRADKRFVFDDFVARNIAFTGLCASFVGLLSNLSNPDVACLLQVAKTHARFAARSAPARWI